MRDHDIAQRLIVEIDLEAGEVPPLDHEHVPGLLGVDLAGETELRVELVNMSAFARIEEIGFFDRLF